MGCGERTIDTGVLKGSEAEFREELLTGLQRGGKGANAAVVRLWGHHMSPGIAHASDAKEM
jgi:hypothetical protein